MNTKQAIKVVLEQHKLWLETCGKQGNRANFEGANLECANLEDANLKNANLEGANFEGAELEDAYLYGANLYGADLQDANLENANLKYACMGGTIFEKKQEKVSEQTVSSSPSNLRAELEAVAKKHGMKIENIEEIKFSFL